MKRGDQKDANHAEICQGLRERGIAVYDMPDPGDVLGYYPPSDTWRPLEIKTAAGKLTPRQAERLIVKSRDYRGAHGTRYRIVCALPQIPIVRNLSDALKQFGLELR